MRTDSARTAGASALVIRWPAGFAGDAAGLRAEPGLSVLVDEAWAWLRGAALAELSLADFACLRGFEVFTERPDESGTWLVRRGATVPETRLPLGEWLALAAWSTPALDSAPWGAAHSARPEPVALQIVRGGAPRDATALMTTMEAFAQWAELAPRHRLRSLRFAADASGRVLITIQRGDPLPPLEGRLFWTEALVYVPCGHRVEPEVPIRSLRGSMERDGSLDAADSVVLDEAGWSCVPANAWVRGGRSAVRATWQSLDNPPAKTTG